MSQGAPTIPLIQQDRNTLVADLVQGDWCDPPDSAVLGLLDGALLLTKSNKLVGDDVLISSMGGALKFKELQAPLPAATRAAAIKVRDLVMDDKSICNRLFCFYKI